MSEIVHARFLEIAEGLTPELHAALARAGPVAFAPSRDEPLPERLCRAVVGQQLSVKAAGTIWRRLLDHAAEQPLLEHFAQADPDALRACGLSGAKTKAVKGVAAMHAAGRLCPDALGVLDAEARKARLIEAPGIGPWTADMINIFWFGERDIWPDGDVTARKTFQRLIGPRRRTPVNARRFAPDRSVLARYMWRIADASPTG